ncbi:hypothetical protein MTR67_006221 [Solanum verrucosum]|uniref:Uncharacterized protein n=1 Tax=Solanum verrucosum TaxID=315347 RepID=A0AAF0Q2R3_SOLVR|nr:hypothetical protein MTR67_006221 [Solanum verrucosum]
MSTEIKCECLDILCDVLQKYGNLMDTDHESLLTSLLPQLSSNQARFRKKSISCIGNLVISFSVFKFSSTFFLYSISLSSKLSDDLLAKATVEVVRLLSYKSSKSEMIRTNIQILGP